MPELNHRLQQVYKEILLYEQEFGREPGSVRLIAVSKTRPAAEIRDACQSGQTFFGESYLQEAVDKIQSLTDLALEWHYIGPIQSNKTRPIAEHFAWVHSIEREKIAQRLNDQRPDSLPPLQVLIQVNTSAEASKSGCTLAALPALAKAISQMPRLTLRGLMTIPAKSPDFEQQRIPFRQLREAMQDLNNQGYKLDTLSMGMSQDIRAAIAEGATMVRVGTTIFGERLKRPD